MQLAIGRERARKQLQAHMVSQLEDGWVDISASGILFCIFPFAIESIHWILCLVMKKKHVEYAESEWLSGYIPNLRGEYMWISPNVGIHPWTPSCILTMDNSSFEWEIIG